MSVARNIPVGVVIRICAHRHLYKKNYFLQNTEELFKVAAINQDHSPKTYALTDLDGCKILGNFYYEELVPVIHDGYFPIKIHQKRRRNKKWEYYVSYVGYNTSKRQWVTQNQLKPLN